MPLHVQARELLDVLAGMSSTAVGEAGLDEARRAPSLGDAERELLRGRGEDTALEKVGRVEDRTIPGPAGDIGVRVYRPRVTGALDRVRGAVGGGALPLLVHCHGGGWVLGDLDTDEATPRGLANRAQCVVVSVDYRRAPEHPFPASHDDVLAVTRWVLDHGDELDGDPARVGIVGESAGATMATAACLALAREGHRVPAAQLLVYPVTDLVGRDWPSYRDASTTPPLTLTALDWFVAQEATDEAQRHDPRLSPLLATPEELGAMPPTLLFTAEEDPLRDQGEAYATALMDARVHVTVSRFPGMMHGFLGRYRVLNGARLALSQGAVALRAGFEGYEGAAQ